MRKPRLSLEHGVEDRQQLAHAGGQRYLAWLAGGTQTTVEGTDFLVASGGSQGGHVESGTYLGASAGNDTPATESTTVAVERSDADERGDLPAGELAQLGKLAEQSTSGLGTDTRDRLEEVFLFAPERRLFDVFVDVGVEGVDLAVEEGDGLLETDDDALGGRLMEAVDLGGACGDELSATRHKGFYGLFGVIGEGTGMGPDVACEACDDGGVEGVGLGELPGGAGEVADLSGIDDGDGDVACGQLGGDVGLVAAGGFEDHEGGLVVARPGEGLGDSLLVVRETTGVSSGESVEVEGILGYVDTDEARFGHLIPFLADSSSLGRLKRLYGLRAGRLPGIQLLYGLEDQEVIDLPAAACPLLSPQQGAGRRLHTECYWRH